MTEPTLYSWLLYGMFGAAFVTILAVTFRTAPYGRHAEAGWGPTVPNWLGWVLMEAPAAITIAAMFTLDSPIPVAAWVLLAIWEIHYVNRAFIFPFRMKSGAAMPLSIAFMGAVFNLYNGYLNGRWLTHFGPTYDASWLTDPRFVIGTAIFFFGMGMNLHADRVLANLRPPGDKGYYIPRGGAYRWVSCPNYLGEILEWTGWAIATWSLPGLGFALYTIANLAPRALANHRWYLKKFSDYPTERRALVPLLF